MSGYFLERLHILTTKKLKTANVKKKYLIAPRKETEKERHVNNILNSNNKAQKTQ